MRRFHHRRAVLGSLALGVAMAVASIVALDIDVGGGGGGGGEAGDGVPAYLDNFELGPTVEEQLAEARARGIEGPVHIPEPNVPPPWLKPDLHGPFLLVPHGWVGALPAGSDDRPFDLPESAPPGTAAAEADVRASTLWREPASVPDGFVLGRVSSEWPERSVVQHWFRSRAPEVGPAEIIELMWWRPAYLPVRIGTWAGEGANVFETRSIEGHAAVVWLPPEQDAITDSVTVWLFDEAEGVVYTGHGAVPPDDLVAMVLSLAE